MAVTKLDFPAGERPRRPDGVALPVPAAAFFGPVQAPGEVGPHRAPRHHVLYQAVGVDAVGPEALLDLRAAEFVVAGQRLVVVADAPAGDVATVLYARALQ